MRQEDNLHQICRQFQVEGEMLEIVPHGEGHIHSTFVAHYLQPDGRLRRTLLQHINRRVFPEPEKMMGNIEQVTEHLRRKIIAAGGDPFRNTINLIPAQDGKFFYRSDTGEKWLDIRQVDKLAPIMRSRLDMCAARGFDAVEPDNIEAYDNDSGFPLTYQDQLHYAIWLADEAHARGFAIGLKNAPDMVADALPYFDFSVVEDCFYYGWCADMLPFLKAGKPVFAIEYTDMKVDFEAACAEAKSLGLTMLLKHRNLDAFLFTCP